MKTLRLLPVLVALIAAPLTARTLEDPPVFLLQWGSFGTGPGQFEFPHGLATDADGNVYLADLNNDRIEVFTGDGVFLRQWSIGGMRRPRGIAISPGGEVYVSDNLGVRVYTLNGILLRNWGGVTDADGIALDAAGNVYVGDTGNGRIRKFTGTGTLITQWGSSGSALGEFGMPSGVVVDSQDKVYVADYANARIQKFDSDGTFISAWATPDLFAPMYLAVDESDNLYVTDNIHDRCFKFTSDGTLILQWGTGGSAQGHFIDPTGIALDHLGNVFVAESTSPNSSRVQKFGLVPTAVGRRTWGSVKAKYR